MALIRRQYLLLFCILLSTWNVYSNSCIRKYNWMDVVFLADTSCPMTTAQCINQQHRIANTLLSIKGIDSSFWIPSIRAAYVEFGSNDVEVIVSLTEAPYNSRGGVTNASIMQYSHLIQQRCGNMTGEREATPLLDSAIKTALNEFNKGPNSDDLRKDKKVVIFSNCPVSDDNIANLCYKWKGNQRNHARDVDFFMVNIGEDIIDPNVYIMCMVEYDVDDILVDTQRDDALFYDDIMETLSDSLCRYPTPIPTIDPTSDPTADPTVNCHTHIMDVVILVDVATAMTSTECTQQQERVARAMVELKGIQDDILIPNVRLSVIEMRGDDVYVRVAIDQYPYNSETGTNSMRERSELYELIAKSGECYVEKEGNANLRDGLTCALNQFDLSDSDRDKKILIFSNSMINSTDSVCQYYSDNKEGDFKDIDIVVYHRNEEIEEDYLECLTDGNVNKILSNPTRDNETYTDQILPALEQLMCTNVYA